jgi:hypothetical protein
MARIGRPQEQVLTLSEVERGELERLGQSQSASHSVVRRAPSFRATERYDQYGRDTAR